MTAPTKPDLRRQIAARRAARPLDVRSADDDARLALIRTQLSERPTLPRRVAAYASVGTEPGTTALLTWLTEVGVEVVLPVLGNGGVRAEPRWARYDGRLRPGAYGIAEPTTVDETVDDPVVDLVLCPGLAGTTSGMRLGRGGGWYDRALPRLAAPTWLLLNDDEVLTDLPADPWDQPVTAIVTATRFVVCG